MTDFLWSAVGATLILAGFLKARQPASVAEALNIAKLPLGRFSREAAYALAAVEAAIGVALIVTPGVWAAGAAGLLFAGFAVYLVLLQRRAPTAGCACFGSADSSVRVALARLFLLIGTLVCAEIGSASPKFEWLGLAAGVEAAALLLLVTEAAPILTRVRARVIA